MMVMIRRAMKWPLYTLLGGIFGYFLGFILMWAWYITALIFVCHGDSGPQWVNAVTDSFLYGGIAVGTIGGTSLLFNYDRKGKGIGSFLFFWLKSLRPALLFRFALYLCLYYGSVSLYRIFVLNVVSDRIDVFFRIFFYILPSFFLYLPLLYWELHASAASQADLPVLRARSTIFSFLVGANWLSVLICFNGKPYSFDLLELIMIDIPWTVIVSIPWTIFGWKAAQKYWDFFIEKRLKPSTVNLALARFTLLYWVIFAASLAAAGGFIFFRLELLPELLHWVQNVLI